MFKITTVFVDNNPDIRDIAKLIFGRPGHEIKIFNTDAPLLKKDHELSDVIFMNTDKPGMG